MFVRYMLSGNSRKSSMTVDRFGIMWKLQIVEVYTLRFVGKSRCLNFMQIDEPREDNKEHKVYSLKVLRSETLRRDALKVARRRRRAVWWRAEARNISPPRSRCQTKKYCRSEVAPTVLSIQLAKSV